MVKVGGKERFEDEQTYIPIFARSFDVDEICSNNSGYVSGVSVFGQLFGMSDIQNACPCRHRRRGLRMQKPPRQLTTVNGAEKSTRGRESRGYSPDSN